jgi:hypothetical protein
MENSLDNDIDEVEIRIPDEVVYEQLLEIPDNRSEYDKQIEKAIALSLSQINQQNAIHIEYEKQILDEYNNETIKRNELSRPILFDINRIIKYDKEAGEIYEIIEPILNAYCFQCIDKCYMDKITYDKIFNFLKNVRTDKKNIEFLKSIILCE